MAEDEMVGGITDLMHMSLSKLWDQLPVQGGWACFHLCVHK